MASAAAAQGSLEAGIALLRGDRTMKNVVKLQHYDFPWELEASLRDFVAYYNNELYHEAIDFSRTCNSNLV